MIKNIIIILLLVYISLQKLYCENLYIYAWSDNIPQNIINKFQKKTGIKVHLTYFDTNEMLLSRLLLLRKQQSYDIIFPSNYYLNYLIDLKLLSKINKKLIPNFVKNFEYKFNNKSNINLEYSIPYTFNFTGILYNKHLINEEIASWKDLYKPIFKQKVLLLNDIREVFQISHTILKHNINQINQENIQDAYFNMLKLLPNIKLFALESLQQDFLSEEVVIGSAWNTEASNLIKYHNNFKFIFPKEGALLSVDNFAILQNAKNKQNAHKFIDFIYEREISKTLINEYSLLIPNQKVQYYYQNHLNDSIIGNSIMLQDIRKENIKSYNLYWNKIKDAAGKE